MCVHNVCSFLSCFLCLAPAIVFDFCRNHSGIQICVSFLWSTSRDRIIVHITISGALHHSLRPKGHFTCTRFEVYFCACDCVFFFVYFSTFLFNCFNRLFCFSCFNCVALSLGLGDMHSICLQMSINIWTEYLSRFAAQPWRALTAGSTTGSQASTNRGAGQLHRK